MNIVNYPAQVDRLVNLLKEVLSWIENWGPDFVDDPEWQELEERIQDELEKL